MLKIATCNIRTLLENTDGDTGSIRNTVLLASEMARYSIDRQREPWWSLTRKMTIPFSGEVDRRASHDIMELALPSESVTQKISTKSLTM